MTEQYPIDHYRPGAAEAAFDYLKRKDEEDDTMVFQGSGYFEPLPPLRDGEITHYAFPIQYEQTEDGTALERIMVADMKGEKPVGFGQMVVLRNREGQSFSGPRVVYTETESDERRKGYGRSRLIALNTYADKLFGQPLQSDVNMEPEAIFTWQSLVRDGLAEELNGRFRFRESATTLTD